MTKTKFEAMDILNKFDIPCGPILSMKEIAEEPSLRATGTVVEVDHPTRGKYLTVGNPIKLSDSADRGQALAAARRAHRRSADASWATATSRSRRCARRRSSDAPASGASRANRIQSQGARHGQLAQDDKSQGPRSSSTPSRRRAATRSPRPRASWSATPTASRCRRKASPTSAAEASQAGRVDGLSGRDEDRLARHPAQDRSRRRDRRREERRRGDDGLRHDPRQREEVQGRRARSSACRCSR